MPAESAIAKHDEPLTPAESAMIPGYDLHTTAAVGFYNKQALPILLMFSACMPIPVQ